MRLDEFLDDAPEERPASNGSIDGLINAIRHVESGGNKNALSPQGASGSMQIMPATFRQYARDGERFDNDEHRTNAAIRKIEDDYNYYDGDIAKTAAAYIGGRGAILKDGSIRSDVKDAHGTSPLAYARMVTGRIGKQPASEIKQKTVEVEDEFSAFDKYLSGRVIEGDGYAESAPGVSKASKPEVPAMSAKSVAQDVLSGTLQIVPTAIKGVADIARMVTGDAVGTDTSNRMKSDIETIQKDYGSERAAVQKKNFEADMANPEVGIGSALWNNKGALADQILPTVGSMFLPVGVAGAAGKLATVGNAVRNMDKAAVTARVASAQMNAGIGAVAAQNAADTFSTLLEKGASMEDAYIGAGISVPFSVVAGKLTGGGAEMAMTRALTGSGAVKAGLKELPKAAFKEGSQEIGEELGQISGEAYGTGEMPTLNSAGKRLAVAGTLGSVMGGGVNVATSIMPQAEEQLAPTPTDVLASPDLDTAIATATQSVSAPIATPAPIAPAPVDPEITALTQEAAANDQTSLLADIEAHLNPTGTLTVSGKNAAEAVRSLGEEIPFVKHADGSVLVSTRFAEPVSQAIKQAQETTKPLEQTFTPMPIPATVTSSIEPGSIRPQTIAGQSAESYTDEQLAEITQSVTTNIDTRKGAAIELQARQVEQPDQSEQVIDTVPSIEQQPQPKQPAAKRTGLAARDDIVGAIMRVTGNKGIAANMAQDITGDTANRVTKLRGLFTNEGTADLGDTAMLLREQEGFDVRDAEHLSELIRDASDGNMTYSMERNERDAAANAEKEYKSHINDRATELGLKKVGGKRTLAMVEADIAREEARLNQLEADAERQAIQAADAIDDAIGMDMTESDWMTWVSFDLAGTYTTEEIQRAEEDRANREDARSQAYADEFAGEQAQGDSGQGNGVAQTAPESGRVEEGTRGTAEEGLTLTGETNAKESPQKYGIYQLADGSFAKFDRVWYRGEKTERAAMLSEMVIPGNASPKDRLDSQSWVFVKGFSRNEFDGSPMRLTKNGEDVTVNAENAPNLELTGETNEEAAANASRKIDPNALTKEEINAQSAGFGLQQQEGAPKPGPVQDGLRFSRNNNQSIDTKEAEEVQAGIEGKSVIDAAKWIAKNAPSQDYRIIATAVAAKLQSFEAIGGKLDLHVAHDGDEVPAGLKYANGAAMKITGADHIEVWINGADLTGKVGTTYETVLHELVHAATMLSIADGQSNLSATAQKSMEDFNQVKEAIKDHFLARLDDFNSGKGEFSRFEENTFSRRNNAMSDDHEIIAWAMTSRDMQDYLEGVPYKSSNLWTSFVESIRKMLGLSPKADTALSEVLRIGKALIDEQPLLYNYGDSKMSRAGFAQHIIRAGDAITAGRGFDRRSALNSDGTKIQPTLENIKAGWKDRGITADLFENKGVITVSRIIVPEGQRSKGVGTKAMNELIAYADDNGRHIALTPSADFGGNKNRLVEFYKRFGFVENKGRNRVFSVSESMVRENPNASSPLYSFSGKNAATPITEQQATTAITNKLGNAAKVLIDAGQIVMVRTEEGLRNLAGAKFMTAWHGSPHDHNKFDSSKIGTGEGAQAYGYGLYFAGARSVAEWYRDNLSSRKGADPTNEKFNGKTVMEWYRHWSDMADKSKDPTEFYDRMSMLEETELNWNPQAALNTATEDELSPKAIEWFKTTIADKMKRPGTTYQVELAPSEDEYLDWDKPLSEQSEIVRKALTDKSHFIGEYLSDALEIANDNGVDFNEYGKSLYKIVSDQYGSDKAASDYLHSIGIRGIRYLDGSSRSAGEGTSNYVIFSDDDVAITAKYAKENGGIQGATLPDGRIVLVLDNLTKDNIGGVLEHEGFHSSIRQLLGEKTYQQLMDRLGQLSKLNKSWAAQAEKSIPTDTKPENWLEEIGAYSIEAYNRGEQLPGSIRKWVEDFLSAIRSAIISSKHMPERAKLMAMKALKPQDLSRLAIAGLKAKANKFQEIENVKYDLESGRFEPDVDAGFIERARASGVQGGKTTLERAAISRTILVSGGIPKGWGERFKPVRSDGSQGFPTVLYSRAAVNQPNALPEETAARKAQRLGQDKLNRFTVIKEWLAKQGTALSEQADVYKAEERMHSRFANKVEDFRDKLVTPLIEKIQKAGFSMEDVSLFLHAQHAKERNEQIAKVNSQMPDGGSGMTTADAANVLAATPAELVALANEFRQITDMTKQVLLDSGVVAKDMIDAWESAYSNYVPLKGGPDEKATKTGTGKGLAINAKMKRALGHGQREGGEWIAENILADYERAVMLAEKNRIGHSLIKMALEVGRDDVITIGKPEKRAILKDQVAYEVRYKGNVISAFNSLEAARTFKTANAAVMNSTSPSDYSITKTSDPSVIYSASPMLQDNEVNVYVNGHAIRLQINDELLARAYKNMGQEAVGAVFTAGRMLNGYLSKIYTGYNPEFILTNIVRDFTTGLANITGEEGAMFAGKAMVNYTKSFGTLLRYAHNGTETKWIKMYREDGGNTGAAYLSDIERLGTEIKTEYDAAKGFVANLNDRNISGAWSAAMRKVFNLTLRHIEKINQAGENAMRLSIYQAAVESGKSRSEAASLAKNSTVNFNRKGEWGQQANAAYLFFNAGVQGTASLAHAHFKGKHKVQAWAVSSGMIALGYMLAASLGDDDEYDKLSDYEKSRNLMIKTEDGWAKIPVPYGYGFFWNMGRTMADAVRKDDFGKMPWHIASSFVGEFTPFGGVMAGDKPDAHQLNYALPTVFSMIGAPIVNRSGMGSPIFPESSYDPSKPDYLKMWRNTKGSMADELAQVLKPVAEVSPEVLKYYGRTFTGGSGSFVGSTIDAAKLKMWDGVDDLEVKEMPFVRKFYKEVSVSDARSAYYTAKNEAKEAENELNRARKANDLKSVQQLRSDNRELLALDKYADSLQKRINAARDVQDTVKMDDKLTVAEKRLKLKILEVEEAKLYDQYLEKFKVNTEARKKRLKDAA